MESFTTKQKGTSDINKIKKKEMHAQVSGIMPVCDETILELYKCNYDK